MKKTIRKNYKWIVAIFASTLLLTIVFYYYYPKQVTGQTYSGQYNGNITMRLDYIDENGATVQSAEGTPLAFFSGTTRIKELRLTITWTTYDVQTGMDITTFRFDGNVSIVDIVTSVGQSWTVNSSIQPFPSISSSVLNSTKTWVFNLRTDPLNLQTEADKHPNDRTDFAITFTLSWKASMYDTIDMSTESATGNLQSTASIWYVKGFKITVK